MGWITPFVSNVDEGTALVVMFFVVFMLVVVGMVIIPTMLAGDYKDPNDPKNRR